VEFWRVLNWRPDALTPAEYGHPLYIWPRQGAGRVDDRTANTPCSTSATRLKAQRRKPSAGTPCGPTGLTMVGEPEPLTMAHVAVQDAAALIRRIIS
jgi:hypothetical protein